MNETTQEAAQGIMERAAEAPRQVGEIARGIMARAKQQGWKGKKADAFALESIIGALNAAIAIHGNEHDLTKRLSMVAFLVSVRGLDYVKERAAEGED